MKFTEMLRARWRNADTLLCVGLDPDLARLPEELAGKPDAIYSFCTGIVDATADLVCAFKPQIAYFASEGAEDALNRVVAYIHSNHPGIPVILDAKRGDIGSTAKHYAEEAFDRYGADCVTLSPYMGGDTLDPYLAYAEKGAFVLCRTLVLMLTAAYSAHRSTPNTCSGFFFLRFSSASLFHSKRFAQNLNVPFIPSHF